MIMETKKQKYFRENIAMQLSKDELVERLVEYNGKIDELKLIIAKYEDDPKVIRDCNHLLYIFLEDLRDYMRESDNNIGYDERDSKEFIELFNTNHPNLIISDSVNWDVLINGISKELENKHNISSEEIFSCIISYIESTFPELFHKSAKYRDRIHRAIDNLCDEELVSEIERYYLTEDLRNELHKIINEN